MENIGLVFLVAVRLYERGRSYCWKLFQVTYFRFRYVHKILGCSRKKCEHLLFHELLILRLHQNESREGIH